MHTQTPRDTFKNNVTIFATMEECCNDIRHEWKNNNKMIYLHIYIVTRNIYSITCNSLPELRLTARIYGGRLLQRNNLAPELWREYLVLCKQPEAYNKLDANKLLDPSGHYITHVIRVNKSVLFRLSTRRVTLLFRKEVFRRTSTISTKYYKSNWGK
jgi:hypothetical protein